MTYMYTSASEVAAGGDKNRLVAPRTSTACRAAALIVVMLATPAAAADWHVAPGGSGSGTTSAPFGRIQDALAAAQPGDTISVAPGTYGERLQSVRSGTAQSRITVRARDGRGSVVVTTAGRVLTVGHGYLTIESLVLDGQFGDDDLLRLGGGANGFTLRNSEVRRTTRDAIDMGAVNDVLIEGSLIHHALNATNGRSDAHGIVAGAARRLTIRNTEVHTFSGDAFQIDPGRSSAGWDDVVIEDCKFWLQPLPAPVNGFAAGVVPGENAVDTKVNSSTPRPRLTIRNTEAWGFRAGLISNMAAFNIKETVDAVIDGVTVHSSEIAFRLRAPASVRVQNAVVYDVGYGVRYEDNIQDVKIWNSTFGADVGQVFRSASSSGSVLDVRNVAILGSARPSEANDGSNLMLPASAFIDAPKHNYHLATTSPANDAGVPLSGVATDRDGTTRPQGTGYDVGAYERVVAVSTPDPVGDAEIVLHAWRAPTMVGNWQVVADATAAGGARLASDNLLGRKEQSLAAAQGDYFEMTFEADSGRPYRLWVRGQALRDSDRNDGVYVQFSDAVTNVGAPVYRIGSSAATIVTLEDCRSCNLDGWGWQDNGTYATPLGPAIYFGRSGPQTIRILVREDGVSVDQIVLSPSAYLTKAPGAAQRDFTILPESY
jgi:hypothetical protein